MSVRLTKVADVSLTCQSGRWSEMATAHRTPIRRDRTQIGWRLVERVVSRAVGLRCTICNHPARPQIDLAIATGLPKRAIAQAGVLLARAVFRRPFTRSMRRLRKLNSWAAISESYRGSEHALPDPKNCMVAARANMGFHKY